MNKKMNQINVTDMTVTELKALAFDILVKIETEQRNLQIINQEIIKKNQPEPKVEPIVSTSSNLV